MGHSPLRRTSRGAGRRAAAAAAVTNLGHKPWLAHGAASCSHLSADLRNRTRPSISGGICSSQSIIFCAGRLVCVRFLCFTIRASLDFEHSVGDLGTGSSSASVWGCESPPRRWQRCFRSTWRPTGNGKRWVPRVAGCCSDLSASRSHGYSDRLDGFGRCNEAEVGRVFHCDHLLDCDIKRHRADLQWFRWRQERLWTGSYVW